MIINKRIALFLIFLFLLYGLSKWIGTWDNKLLQKRSNLQMAAEQGDMRAQNDLGLIYEVGNEIEVDYNKSFYWYKKSAEQEFAPALYNLGRYYENGIGVNKDPRVAREYYSRSARQGFALAQVNLGKLLLDGKGGDIDYNQAHELFKKAAEVGSSVAMYDLGYMYENGLGIPKDDTTAAEWYIKAADRGSWKARNSLALYYAQGLGGVHINRTKALNLLKLSACQGYSIAQVNLGMLYSGNTGDISLDYIKAYAWLSVAIHNGYYDAKSMRAKTVEKIEGNEMKKAIYIADEYIKKYSSNAEWNAKDKECKILLQRGEI
ncbi:tetratricopeptide repeat protein [Kluyvera sp. NPDC087067]|uniref:tetratricopeptide repeat protein n=1 Tax=Kluyvera sp. NPDC087067 TaxID=3364105 RepID=UPI0038034D14